MRPMQRHRVRRRKDGGWWGRPWRRTRALLRWAAVVGFFFMVSWLISFRMNHDPSDRQKNLGFLLNTTFPALLRSPFPMQANVSNSEKGGKPHQLAYKRLLSLMARALANAKGKPEPQDLWMESLVPTMSWTPCADKRRWKPNAGTNGYILVSANGGISQQRGAICNVVTVARLLNATLVLPRFLYSNVWQDTSQFDDIYQEEYFINYLKDDIRIVKELPIELQSLDLKGIGSLVTDDEVMKEAKPSFYVKKILPILLKNGVVHFTGFGNRLAFDHIPFDLQDFHSIVRGCAHLSEVFAQPPLLNYLRLLTLTDEGIAKPVPSPEVLRSEGQCPLMPEEAVLMLAALGFKRNTRIYVAGADIYGGKSRMRALKSLYSNLANKETLLSPSEIEPFRNYSSQVSEDLGYKLAALDFIACAAADAFAMTDSGSQLSSLVAGYRVYYGSGMRPTIRPNKRRFSTIFSKNSTIGWKQFEIRIRKAVRQTKMIHERPTTRSIYSYPGCPECMCPANS
ncbi:Uncharacterized protein AXF42_Ash016353 [Apostasia shenzhenica]|uniref:O-fucosyltransferase family protein n=1 Tax=Apostasia shenzhenica TaxID=1088818 RepID=A0A2H9ZZZ2_9ASPA|nr:Uncharacterized protein AXF42_Ash016353 [Apostasia shenzhenica]